MDARRGLRVRRGSPEIMRILIVSLKYSPVHNAHCRALGEPLGELGFDVKCLLAGALRWTVTHSQLEHTAFIGSSRNVGEVLWDTLASCTWRQLKLRKLLQEFPPCLLVFESSEEVVRHMTQAFEDALPGMGEALSSNGIYQVRKDNQQ